MPLPHKHKSDLKLTATLKDDIDAAYMVGNCSIKKTTICIILRANMQYRTRIVSTWNEIYIDLGHTINHWIQRCRRLFFCRDVGVQLCELKLSEMDACISTTVPEISFLCLRIFHYFGCVCVCVFRILKPSLCLQILVSLANVPGLFKFHSSIAITMINNSLLIWSGIMT